KADAKTAPGPHLTLRIGGNHLTARYKARQTTAYVVKNRSPHDRALVIEHPIRRDWELVAPARPAERSRDVYRFRVGVAAGQSARFEVAEEQARVDERELQNGKEPYYAVAEGVEVKQLVKSGRDEPVSLKVVHGALHTGYRVRESRTYFVQNNSDQERTFRVDHLIRADWKRLEGQGEGQAGPAGHPFPPPGPGGPHPPPPLPPPLPPP